MSCSLALRYRQPAAGFSVPSVALPWRGAGLPVCRVSKPGEFCLGKKQFLIPKNYKLIYG